MKLIIQQLIEIISKEFTVMLTAALPIIELRGAIPVGISLGLSPIHSAIISFIGSMIPVPFILFTVRPIFNYLKRTKIFKNMINRLTDRSIAKSGKVQKFGAWGLFIFVAIPLPGTGVWSGSLIASLLNMRFKLAFPAIFFGNFTAGIIILLFSYGFLNMISN